MPGPARHAEFRKEPMMQSRTRKEAPLSSLGISMEGGGWMLRETVRSGHYRCGR